MLCLSGSAGTVNKNMECCHVCTCKHILGMPNETCYDQLPLWLWLLAFPPSTCLWPSHARFEIAVCDDPGCVADHVQMTAEAKIDPTTKVKTANHSELTRLTPFDFACAAPIVSWLSRRAKDGVASTVTSAMMLNFTIVSRRNNLLGHGSRQSVFSWFLALPPAHQRLVLLLRRTQGAQMLVEQCVACS